MTADPQPQVRARGVHLLIADPELGQDLAADELEQAREQIVLPMVDVHPGPLEVHLLRDVPGVHNDVYAFLVLSGMLTINLRMAARQCTRVVSTGALVLLDGPISDSIPARVGWAALDPVRLALLDDRFLVIVHRWPKLVRAIFARAAQQPRQALLQQAISQLPRVEDRLLALLWSVADRHGTVRQDGVWVPMPVTHDMLASMVGAQRPTVSLGMTRLVDTGLVRAEPGGWLLSPDSASILKRLPALRRAGRVRCGAPEVPLAS